MHEGGTLTRYQSGTLRVLAQQLVEFLVDEHAEAA
jgi:hypothetical protein